MPTYTATFRTETAFAEQELEAPTAAEALAQARTLGDDPAALAFVPYDGPFPVDEIEITGEESAALWQSDDLRLRLAARVLLDALDAAACPVWVHNAAITDDIEALRKIALWHADWNNHTRAAALELVKTGGT